MKKSKIKTLTDEAITIIRSRKANCFRLEQLMGAMSVDRSVASQIVSQMKKDQFLETQDKKLVGDLNDSSNRGRRLFRVKNETPNDSTITEECGWRVLRSEETIQWLKEYKARFEINVSLRKAAAK